MLIEQYREHYWPGCSLLVLRGIRDKLAAELRSEFYGHTKALELIEQMIDRPQYTDHRQLLDLADPDRVLNYRAHLVVALSKLGRHIHQREKTIFASLRPPRLCGENFNPHPSSLP